MDSPDSARWAIILPRLVLLRIFSAYALENKFFFYRIVNLHEFMTVYGINCAIRADDGTPRAKRPSDLLATEFRVHLEAITTKSRSKHPSLPVRKADWTNSLRTMRWSEFGSISVAASRPRGARKLSVGASERNQFLSVMAWTEDYYRREECSCRW